MLDCYDFMLMNRSLSTDPEPRDSKPRDLVSKDDNPSRLMFGEDEKGDDSRE